MALIASVCLFPPSFRGKRTSFQSPSLISFVTHFLSYHSFNCNCLLEHCLWQILLLRKRKELIPRCSHRHRMVQLVQEIVENLFCNQVGYPDGLFGVDIIELPITEQGSCYVIVFQDFLTKWPLVSLHPIKI